MVRQWSFISLKLWYQIGRMHVLPVTGNSWYVWDLLGGTKCLVDYIISLQIVQFSWFCKSQNLHIADLLPEFVSAGKAFPWPQDSLLWRRTIPFLHNDRSRQSGLPHGRILLKGKPSTLDKHFSATCEYALCLTFCKVLQRNWYIIMGL